MKLEMPGYFKALLADQTPPCISIYMPTQRAKPPAAENPRRLRDLIDRAEEQLVAKFGRGKAAAFVEPFRQILHDPGFWAHPTDALAVFGSPATFQAVKLQGPVRELVEVADTFHLKPLMREQQFNGNFQVLCLSPRHVALYEGNRNGIHETPLRHVPHNIIEATGQRTTNPRLSEQKAPPTPGGEARTNSISGTVDIEQFFRAVDKSIWEFHSRQAGLPLILCTDVDNVEPFHRISHNPNLAKQSICINPEAITTQRLLEEAWKIIEPQYRLQIEKVIDEYGRAKAHRQGSDDIHQVAEAATFSRVGTLLVDADKHVGGTLDPQTGRVHLATIRKPEANDVIDEIAEKVMKTGGQVLVMPHEQMPTDTGLAAIYRF